MHGRVPTAIRTRGCASHEHGCGLTSVLPIHCDPALSCPPGSSLQKWAKAYVLLLVSRIVYPCPYSWHVTQYSAAIASNPVSARETDRSPRAPFADLALGSTSSVRSHVLVVVSLDWTSRPCPASSPMTPTRTPSATRAQMRRAPSSPPCLPAPSSVPSPFPSLPISSVASSRSSSLGGSGSSAVFSSALRS